jgi:hypothetical protein
MSTVKLGGEEVSLGIAVQRLIKEVINLQTKNGEVTARLNALTVQNNEQQTTIEVQHAQIAALTLQLQQVGGGSSFDVSTTITKFSGPAKENIINFITKVEQAQKLGGWNDNRTLLITKQYLKEEALKWCQSDDTVASANNYDDFKKLLSDRFKQKNTPRFYREKLGHLRLQEKEDKEPFADRIRQVNAHTYTLTDNADQNSAIRFEADQRALDTFLNGLTGEFGQLTRQSRPTTFQDAVTTAVELEAATRRYADDAPTRNVFYADTGQRRGFQPGRQRLYQENWSQHYPQYYFE